MGKFKSWCTDNKVASWDSSPVEIATDLPQGNGLVARAPISKGSCILEIPRPLMMSIANSSQLNAELKSLIDQDQLISRTPPLCLALFLLDHKLNQKEASFWAPYINILPRTFDIPLYWDPPHFATLRKSLSLTTYRQSVGIIVNTALQYCHVFSILSRLGAAAPFALEHFTWTNFRWAISVVLTRQNELPSVSSPSLSQTAAPVALIPFWDMCNHDTGEMTSFYNVETDRLESSAIRDYCPGEQVFMFYGPRPNSQLLLFSGFVHPDNPYDHLTIQLSADEISRHLSYEKETIIHLLGLSLSQLTLRSLGRLDDDAVTLVRILAASPEDLQFIGVDPHRSHKRISVDNEQRAVEIFHQLLLPLSVAKDLLAVSDPILSQIRIFLQEEEKIIQDTRDQLSSISAALQEVSSPQE